MEEERCLTFRLSTARLDFVPGKEHRAPNDLLIEWNFCLHVCDFDPTLLEVEDRFSQLVQMTP
jgi:hypothetical protein